MNADLNWPSPPHFEVIIKGGGDDLATANVVFNDGRRMNGNVIRLDPAGGILEIHPEKSETHLSISFSNLKSLRLTQPVELKRLPMPTAQNAMDVYPTSERQRCVVRFKDGEELISQTVGFVSQKFGLFLFLNDYSTRILRWFIPAESIANCEIGEQIGKILVDQKILSPELIDAGLEKQQQLRSQRLGDYLKRENLVSQQQLEAALKNQKGMPPMKLGEALLAEKLITSEQLDDALKTQSQDRKLRLGEILVDMGVVDNEAISRTLVQKLGIPYVNLQKFQFDPTAVEAIPAALAKKHSAIPLYRTDTRMVVAIENPLAWDSLQELSVFTKLKVDPVIASPKDLAITIERFYSTKPEDSGNISDLMSELGGTDEQVQQSQEDVVTESDSVLVRLVNRIILDAYKQNASDIHIEAQPGNKPSKVRFRKDGVMAAYSDIPAKFRTALVSRIKIMSRLDISEKRHAQDGKLNFEQFGPAKIELRIVTIPTTNGLEDVVMRILAAPKAVSLDSIGLAPHVLSSLKKVAVKPHGLLFVCGPTGSGKTTTLHSLLSYINTPERKIWTAEDPVEITQEGLRQVQVNAKIDWTFASVLRTFLRADPDVIMVGETRDPETAKIVVEASLTGHLVLSTMHTNSAAESVVRLLDLGLDPFNFADALLAVLSQRLARRLCPACKKPHVASDEELNALAHEYCRDTELNINDIQSRWKAQYVEAGGAPTIFSAEGCDVCDKTGYKGRLGIHELLVMSPEVKKKVYASANVREISRTAMAEGMQTLRQDGIEKILLGHTDLTQVEAVCL